ncbi:MAG: hypothetical protein Q7S30_03410 [Candidatus Omnitrophota bacterium]|nr:hypothetical protein [Candidatus Omnitrophota bacterium]
MEKSRIAAVVFIVVMFITVSTIGFAQEQVKITTIVPSQTAGTVKGTRGAIGNTYKDKTDAVIGANNFLVEGVVKADGGLVIQNVASQASEDAMVKVPGQLWLRTDI